MRTPIDFQQLVAFSEKALTRLQDPEERAMLCLMHLIGSRSMKERVPIYMASFVAEAAVYLAQRRRCKT